MEMGVFVSSRILTLRPTGQHGPPLQWASSPVVCRALLGHSFSSGHENLCLLKRGTIWSKTQSPGFLSKDTTQHTLPRQSRHSLWALWLTNEATDAATIPSRCFPAHLSPCQEKRRPQSKPLGPPVRTVDLGREPRLGSGSMHVHQSNGLRSPVWGCGREKVVPASAQEKGGCPTIQDPAPAWVQVWGCTQCLAPCLLSKQYTTGILSFKWKHNYQWNWKLQTSK